MEHSPLLKTLEHALEETQAIPLWGSPPPFPWEAFSEELAKTLEQKKLEITHHKSEWLSQKELTDGMGDNPSIQAFTLSPLPGAFLWVIPKEGRDALVQKLLTKTDKAKKFSDPALQEGFYNFACLNILETFNQKSPYGNLTASLSENAELPEDGALCTDVSIQCDGITIWGRVICPRETHAGFRSHFTMDKPPLLSDPSLATIPLSLQLTVGSTSLSAKQWHLAAVGDFILLDHCTYDVEHGRGNAILTIGNAPLFDARIKEGEVKILEYALFQKENPMTEELPPEETPPPEIPPEEIPETPEMENSSKDDPLWATKNGEEGDESLLSSKEIPITLTVEVGRFKMPLKKVTQLKPGNVLDLALGPQPIVHLTIEGRRVAKGELVHLGEALGVKILNLGD